MTAQSDNARRAADLPPSVGCEGKRAFESRALAEAIYKRCSKSRVSGRTLYRCHHCKLWHLGGSNRDNGKRKALRRAALERAAQMGEQV